MDTFNHHTLNEESFADIEKDASHQENDESDLEPVVRRQATEASIPQSAPVSHAQNSREVIPQQNLSATDWNGPNDPDNPHNWPMSQRIYHAVTPALFGFAV